MKLVLLPFILVLMLSTASAQKNAIADQRAAKFVSYFNAGQTDSLYTLMGDAVKLQVPLATLSSAVQQLKNGYGTLVTNSYKGTQNGANIYVATFEKPGIVLYIAFDQTTKVVGFSKGVVDVPESPGSITVRTSDAVLKGTLSVPQINKSVPVMLLIAGSGPTDRDGNSQLLSGKSNYFLMISDALKEKNIAVLRYDKRAVGQSTTTNR